MKLLKCPFCNVNHSFAERIERKKASGLTLKLNSVALEFLILSYFLLALRIASLLFIIFFLTFSSVVQIDLVTKDQILSGRPKGRPRLTRY